MAVVSEPDLAQRLDTALVDLAARRSRIDQGADGALLQPAGVDMRLQLLDALGQQLLVKNRLRRPPLPGRVGLDPDRSLPCRVAIDREEQLFGRAVARIAIGVESGYDL